LICPKGKISRARRDKRRAQNWKIKWPQLVNCPRCHELTLPHKVCRTCGYYNGQIIILKEAK